MTPAVQIALCEAGLDAALRLAAERDTVPVPPCTRRRKRWRNLANRRE
jgi:hypothetical protein